VNELIDQTLGQYHIVEKIGAGGMATVYKAHQPSLNRYVALKVLAPFHAEQPGFSERFQREAQAVANLHHPNVLPVYDFGQEGDYSFIAMRYVEGARTLKEVMETPRSLQQVADLIGQVGAALDHAHQRGVVHRDVKPSNVLMDGDWALLTDFGIAKITEASVKLTGTGVGIGTPAYMSPEQGQGLPVDHRTDVYSLGIILFEMLTGQIPHDAETPFGIVIKRISEPLPEPRIINPDISQPVESVILKALASDPAERFQTAGEMAHALTQAAKGFPGIPTAEPVVPSVPVEPVITPPPSVPPIEAPPLAPTEPAATRARAAVPPERRPERKPKRRPPPWVWGALGGVILLLGLGLSLALRGGGGEPTAVAEKPTETRQMTPAATRQPTDTRSPTATEQPPPATPTSTATPPPPTAGPTATQAPIPLPTGIPDSVSASQIVFYTQRGGNSDIYVMAADGSAIRPLTNAAGNNEFPSVAPDGRWIVFQSDRDGNLEIYKMRLDGEEQTRLTFDDGDDRLPTWSSDSQQILFSSNRDGNFELYLMDADGRNPRRLTHNPRRDGHASWSPNGQIVFNAGEDDNPNTWEIYVMNADGGDERRLTRNDVNDWSPNWSPDGRQILFLSRRGGADDPALWVMKADGSQVRPLHNIVGAYDWGAAWSPDGDYVAFTSDTSGQDDVYLLEVASGQVARLTTEGGMYPSWVPSPAVGPGGLIAYAAGPNGAWQIFIADPTTGEIRLLPGQPANSGVPAWSPDGEKLIFRSDVSGAWQIFSIDRDGSDLRQLTVSEDDNLEPTWSPDGTKIAFVSQRDGNKELYVMDGDGANQRRLTTNPDWDDDPSWSPDGSWLVFESRREGRMDVYKMRVDGSEVVRLTRDGDVNSTPAWSPDGRFIAFERKSGAVFHIWIMNADGGEQQQITTDGTQNYRPAWSPDGREIAYTSDRAGGEAVWIIPVDGSESPRRLSLGEGFDPAWSRR